VGNIGSFGKLKIIGLNQTFLKNLSPIKKGGQGRAHLTLNRVFI